MERAWRRPPGRSWEGLPFIDYVADSPPGPTLNPTGAGSMLLIDPFGLHLGPILGPLGSTLDHFRNQVAIQRRHKMLGCANVLYLTDHRATNLGHALTERLTPPDMTMTEAVAETMKVMAPTHTAT